MEHTQNTTVIPLAEDVGSGLFTQQWLLEQRGDKRHAPVQYLNELKVLVCGHEAFGSIAADLRRARHSVQIICWGFDPAMELAREGAAWPRGDTFGALLSDVAAGRYNGRRPVEVQILCWYDELGSTSPLIGVNNMPGYSRDASQAYKQPQLPSWDPQPQPRAGTLEEQRASFQAKWYAQAFGGEFPHLSIRTRGVPGAAARASLADETAPRDFTETKSLTTVATDHQKTILIDYDHEDGARAVGYVMGLNSLTDYWDTREHLYDDKRRGAAWESDSASDGHPGLKPYQDYACRIRGEVLVSVAKNFADAWNRAPGRGRAIDRVDDLSNPPKGLSRRLTGPLRTAQIVRTQPDEGDKSVKRLYWQATSSAYTYIYIENQYVQYGDWTAEVKRLRKKYAALWKAAGRSVNDLQPLYVMIVMPKPEKTFMVPRTYDALASLGLGQSMPQHDKRIRDELDAYAKQKAARDAYLARVKAGGYRGNEFGDPPPVPRLSAQAQSAVDATKLDPGSSLDTLGIRAMVASLWTCDGGKAGHARHREIYIHSKLMIIDDAFYTLGSANLNLRSMSSDAEMNIGCADWTAARELRKEVWGLHTAGQFDGRDGSPQAIADAFDSWVRMASDNWRAMNLNNPTNGFLMRLEDKRTSAIRLM